MSLEISHRQALNEVSHLRKTRFRQPHLVQQQNPSYLRYTEHSPRSQTLPSELDWNISALLRTHTPSSIQHTHLSHYQTPPLLSSHCPHSCHFSRRSTIQPFNIINSCTLLSPLPPVRLVRLVRKQLMELSSAKTHHNLLYPLYLMTPRGLLTLAYT